MHKNMYKKERIKYFLITLTIVSLMCTRLHFGITRGDEILNTLWAKKIALGQRPFFDVWELFQTGSIFSAPFVSLYIKITGGTTGLVLFNRFVYLFFNIILMYIIYKLFSKISGKENSIWCGAALMCYAPLSLYYIWYESVMVFFSFLGTVFLLTGIYAFNTNDRPSSQNKTEWKNICLFVLTGLCYGCMSLAYPTFIFVALYIFLSLLFLWKTKKIDSKCCIGYTAGGLIIAIIFAIYILLCGYKDFFLLNNSVSELIFARKDYSNIFHQFIYPIVEAGYSMLPYLIGVIIIVITWYIQKRIQSEKLKLAVIIEILIIPLIAFNFVRIKFSVLLFFLCYFAALTPFLFSYIPKEKQEFAKSALIITLPASIIGFFAVGYTSDLGGMKSGLGCTVGFVFCLLEIAIILEDYQKNANAKNSHLPSADNPNKLRYIKIIFSNMLALVVTAELLIFYTHQFFYESIGNCNYKFSEGCYAGIYGAEEDSYYDKLFIMLDNNIIDSDNTIMVTNSNLSPAYMYKKLIPANFFFQSKPYIENKDGSQDWSGLLMYWKSVTGEPDIILTSKDDNLSGEIAEILENNYTLINSELNTKLYRHK